MRAPGTVEEIVMIKNWILAFKIFLDLENPGIDPGTSRMLSERSTIWANSPAYYLWEIKSKNISFKFLRSDWLISLYARSIRFRQIFRSIRYPGDSWSFFWEKLINSVKTILSSFVFFFMVPGLLPKILVLFLMPPNVELLFRALPTWLNVFLVNRRIWRGKSVTYQVC